MPGEVKVLTRTEIKTIRDEDDQNPSMDVPKYPDEQVEDSIGPDASDMSLYEEPLSQSDKFERSLAGDPETEPSSPSEEAPPEVIPVEEPSED